MSSMMQKKSLTRYGVLQMTKPLRMRAKTARMYIQKAKIAQMWMQKVAYRLENLFASTQFPVYREMLETEMRIRLNCILKIWQC